MTLEQVREDVEKIIEKYCNDEELYHSFRYEINESDDEIEYSLKDELEKYFKTHNIEYKISQEDGFDSPGYSEDFMAIAFSVKDGHGYSRLDLITVVFEYN